MRVVIDTNVVVSAMLSPHAPPARVVQLALEGELMALHDARILAEYREVLARPKFGFDGRDVRDLVDAIRWSGQRVSARPLPVTLPDPDDLPFLEVAAAGSAQALVTGNLRHYEPVKERHGVALVTPRDLLTRLADRWTG